MRHPSPRLPLPQPVRQQDVQLHRARNGGTAPAPGRVRRGPADRARAGIGDLPTPVDPIGQSGPLARRQAGGAGRRRTPRPPRVRAPRRLDPAGIGEHLVSASVERPRRLPGDRAGGGELRPPRHRGRRHGRPDDRTHGTRHGSGRHRGRAHLGCPRPRTPADPARRRERPGPGSRRRPEPRRPVVARPARRAAALADIGQRLPDDPRRRRSPGRAARAARLIARHGALPAPAAVGCHPAPPIRPAGLLQLRRQGASQRRTGRVGLEFRLRTGPFRRIRHRALRLSRAGRLGRRRVGDRDLARVAPGHRALPHVGRQGWHPALRVHRARRDARSHRRRRTCRTDLGHPRVRCPRRGRPGRGGSPRPGRHRPPPRCHPASPSPRAGCTPSSRSPGAALPAPERRT